MTTYYGPAAAGSGVVEVIGYLNGVNYPGFMEMRTLYTKIMGVTFAVCAKLCVGKEGPLAHIGAIIGTAVLYIPGFGFEHLRNDEIKRLFVAAGASTGVSVAFGAPIGGALFCYELSKPNTFWKFHMIWKVFFACSLGTFTLAILTGLMTGNFEDWTGAQIKFGTDSVAPDGSVIKINVIKVLPYGLFLGVSGGLLGALFINVNSRVNDFRKVLLTTKWIKPIETAFFAFMTSSIFFLVPYLMAKNRCINISNLSTVAVEESVYAAWCPTKDGEVEEFNPLASLFWTSEG